MWVEWRKDYSHSSPRAQLSFGRAWDEEDLTLSYEREENKMMKGRYDLQAHL